MLFIGTDRCGLGLFGTAVAIAMCFLVELWCLWELAGIVYGCLALLFLWLCVSGGVVVFIGTGRCGLWLCGTAVAMVLCFMVELWCLWGLVGVGYGCVALLWYCVLWLSCGVYGDW